VVSTANITILYCVSFEDHNFLQVKSFAVILTCDMPKIEEFTQKLFFCSLTILKTDFVQPSRIKRSYFTNQKTQI